MAQLIKLQDYISRYEHDLSRYPSQFVRLKREQWQRLLSGQPAEPDHPAERPSFFTRWFRKRAQEELEPDHHESDWQEEQEEADLHFEPTFVYRPEESADLKRLYLDQLFHFQLKWASSTLLDKSTVSTRFYRDTLLRQLTQRLPDNYLLLYYPILLLKKAPIELDVILIGPTECYCITVAEQEPDAVYTGGSERFWTKKVQASEKKLLNPLISLNRMESVVSRLFTENGVELPIRKIILSRNGYLDVPVPLYGIELVDKRQADAWFDQLIAASAPFKRMQFKAAETLLKASQTTAFRRLDTDEGTGLT